AGGRDSRGGRPGQTGRRGRGARQGTRTRPGGGRLRRAVRRPGRTRRGPDRGVWPRAGWTGKRTCLARASEREHQRYDVIPLTLAEIGEATGGDLVGGDPLTTVTGSVEFDSRQVGAGGLFVAFSGARADGHDFAADAMAAGAVAVLGTRPVDAP